MAAINIKILKLYSHTAKDTSKIIDFGLLEKSYYSGCLQGAHIFALLFKIIEHSNFKQSKEEYIDLTFYHIYEDEWNLLFGFIKNEQLPFCEDYSKDIYNLNKCYEVTLKLGGIPAFDNYYKNKINSYKCEIIQNYNPMTPQEDIQNKYTWKTINSLTRNNVFMNDESVTIPLHDKSSVLYVRKEKLSSDHNSNSDLDLN